MPCRGGKFPPALNNLKHSLEAPKFSSKRLYFQSFTNALGAMLLCAGRKLCEIPHATAGLYAKIRTDAA
jgi:hypothetical protein